MVVGVLVVAAICLPAAYLVLGLGRIEFVVINDSGSTLKNVEVSIYSTAYGVGDIDSGGRGQTVMYKIVEGGPDLKFRREDRVYNIALDLYVTAGMHGTVNVEVHGDRVVVKDSITPDVGCATVAPVTNEHLITDKDMVK